MQDDGRQVGEEQENIEEGGVESRQELARSEEHEGTAERRPKSTKAQRRVAASALTQTHDRRKSRSCSGGALAFGPLRRRSRGYSCSGAGDSVVGRGHGLLPALARRPARRLASLSGTSPGAFACRSYRSSIASSSAGFFFR